jgi:hypothetical protein
LIDAELATLTPREGIQVASIEVLAAPEVGRFATVADRAARGQSRPVSVAAQISQNRSFE